MSVKQKIIEKTFTSWSKQLKRIRYQSTHLLIISVITIDILYTLDSVSNYFAIQKLKP
jgi:predicted tellurium resistance membrane protein TerC